MNDKLKSTAVFNNEYGKLNRQQKKAVDHIEGPLLVIAGPGTGKTQILTIRIGNILLKTDADAKNILCLTYTESGAANMRKRLIEFIGPTAYDVTIATFHSFCNQVIRENPESFLHYSNYELLSDLEKVQIYQQLFSELDKNNPLYNYKDNYQHEYGRLSALFEKIKKENWDPETMLQDIDLWIEDQKQSNDFVYKRKTKNANVGDFNFSKFEKVISRPFEKTKAAIGIYQKFIAVLDKLQRYEYEDMIQWVIRQFDNDEALLLKYQETYQYILVDEYQDTNGAQNKILFQLLNYHDNPNVFAVGDDDQAIFRFQGANVQNIFDFVKLYQPEKIRLVSNYRSSQIILEAANSLITNNQERLVSAEDASSLLVAQGEFASSTTRPYLTLYPDKPAEILHVCQQIKTLLSNGVSSNQIAVLYRKNAEAEAYVKWLSAHKIPHRISRDSNLLDDFFIQQILLLIRYFQNEQATPYFQDHQLYRILHAPFIALDALDIGKIAFKHNALRQQAFKNSEEQGETEVAPDISLLSILGNEPLLTELKVNKIRECLQLRDQILLFQKQISDYTPQVFLEKLIQEFRILNYILGLDDKFHYLQLLNSLFEFIKIESDKNPQWSILDFAKLFEEYQNNRLSIPFKSTTGSAKGLVLSTLHSAKGEEYEYVFMVNCTQANWKSLGGKSFKLPDQYVKAQINAEEDLRRLFYVGITRAKTGLYLSYALAGEKSESAPCRFIEEIKAGGQLDERKHLAEENDSLDQLIIQLSPLKKEFAVMEQDQFDKFLENFRLNPTALNKFLKCPVAFYYEKVLKIPGARTPALGFGNAVHFALELFMKTKGLHFSDPESKLLKYFRLGMEKYHSHFTPREFKNYMEEGERVLGPFIHHHMDAWNEALDHLQEVKITTEVKDVPITGKLDRIDVLKHGLRVIDYKTGNPDKGKVNAPNATSIYGSDYWQQMVFYAVLLRNHRHYKNSPVKSVFYFVNPNKENKYVKNEVEPEEFVSFLEELIVETYNKIKNKDFTPGCGKSDCEWCNYIDSGAVVGMVEEEESEDLEE